MMKKKNNWFLSERQRRDMSSLHQGTNYDRSRYTAKAGRANALYVSREICELPDNLRDYPLDYLYYMDETGLLFNVLWRKTYLLGFE